MSHELSRKRARHEDTELTYSSSNLDAVCRSKDFWFADGNIILQGGNVQYRLHKSVLSANSIVFRDMFSVPQPQDGPISNDSECPVVPLHDSEVDVGNMVALLYDGLTIHPRHRQPSLSVLTTMLRLGRKYHFKNLRTQAVLELEKQFPTSFSFFEEKIADLCRLDLAGVIDTLMIAHENSVRSVLPCLYAIICMTISSDRDIVSHFSAAQKRFQTTHPLSSNPFRFPEPSSFLAARGELRVAIPKTTFAWFMTPEFKNAMCRQPAKCRRRWNEMSRTCLEKPFVILAFSFNPWDRVQAMSPYHLCESCLVMVEADYRCGMFKLWEQMPKILALDREGLAWDLGSDDDAFKDTASGL